MNASDRGLSALYPARQQYLQVEFSAAGSRAPFGSALSRPSKQGVGGSRRRLHSLTILLPGHRWWSQSGHATTHTVRIGGATKLLNAGADLLAVKILGRWLSNCFEVPSPYGRRHERSVKANNVLSIKQSPNNGRQIHPNVSQSYTSQDPKGLEARTVPTRSNELNGSIPAGTQVHGILCVGPRSRSWHTD